MVNKIISSFKRYKFKGVFFNVLFKIPKIFGCHFEIWELFSKKVTYNNSHYEYQLLNFESFQKNINTCPSWFTEEKLSFLERWCKDERLFCVGIYDKNVLVSYGFCASQKFNDTDILLKAGDIHTFDHFTNPSYRGQGYHKKLLQSIENECYKRGAKRLLTRIILFNYASKSAFYKLGYTCINRYCEFQLLRGKRKTTFKYE